ncbi:HlyD family secretion protein [Ancylobacter dichloromethanicus]|uniref:Multidrug resistance protein n=1 Tax=Ancylobacter dichloromethanicus TaxID=518825 RepID=A0A9W6J568_9HYPH|nr:HlyD family secretion protein [Ancylobacter dichloromethanicus]MBS7553918.1 HlyD family secretion protein [Ancylobacter dichloromethanicus]GLK71026.1 multidrug resistance protein [Ancylobacter dichloromethanicus]
MAQAEIKAIPSAEAERPYGSEPIPITARKTAPETARPSERAEEPTPKRVRSRKPLIFGAVLVAALAGGAYYGLNWWQVGRFLVSTDDAYVGADTSILAAKVGGYIVGLDAETNQTVKAGDVIARIDDGDYRLSLRAAENRIATQRATVARYGEQMAAARAQVDQARAQLVADEAELQRTELEFGRQSELVKSQYSSRATLDNARADRDKAKASVDAAKAAVASAEANVTVLDAQRTEAMRTLDELNTARDQAQRDLDFTIVRAPFDGVVGNRAVQVGQLVQAGTRLVALVPMSQVYVDANFKETQLAGLRPGQKVDVEVDAYPDETFHGEVVSVAPASGSVFSMLPPENATGNFTKIVQRVPVRIELDAAARAKAELRPGMSVVATIDTRS